MLQIIAYLIIGLFLSPILIGLFISFIGIMITLPVIFLTIFLELIVCGFTIIIYFIFIPIHFIGQIVVFILGRAVDFKIPNFPKFKNKFSKIEIRKIENKN